jgi:hypothetical protein
MADDDGVDGSVATTTAYCACASAARCRRLYCTPTGGRVELAGTPELSPHLEKMAGAGKMRSLCRRQEHEKWRTGRV